MPLEDICKMVAQRLLEGAMKHEQFANYYNFLGLKGYKCFHEYHFFEQILSYRKFITYYIDHEDKIFSNFSFNSLNSFSIVPENWSNYLREDVDINTRRSAIKTGLEKYVHWEIDTKKFLEDLCSQSIQQGLIAISLEIKKYICSVDKEIKHAKEELLEAQAVDYDLPTLVSKQDILKKKYNKEKLCKIFEKEKGK